MQSNPTKSVGRLSRLGSVLALVLMGAGCGGQGEAATGVRRLAVIPKGTSHEFWKTVHAGAEKAAQERGVELIWKGPAREDDRGEQIKVVETFVTRGVDGILVAPLDDKALVAPLQDADRNGIPVVVFDSDVDWAGRKSFVATDNLAGGRLAAQRMGEVLGGKGRIVVLRYQEGSSSTNKREAGFLDTLAAEFPGIEVVSSNQYGGATTGSCISMAENLMTRFPDVDGVFGPCEPVTFAFLKVLRDLGKAGQTKLVGFDATEEMVNGLRQGHIHGLVVQDPFAMGERGVHALMDAIEGKPVEPFVDTGVKVVTQANMDEPDSQRVLSPDLDKWLK